MLPVLEVRGCDFDWKSFLDASGMNWDGFEALKHTGTMFSVLSFLSKLQVFALRFLRSF